MDNQNFIQESKRQGTDPVVIPPALKQPFTAQFVREAITKVATGQLDHSGVADQLNRMAHIFYSKK